MTDVRFLQDYRGELTGEQYYTAGTVAAFPDGQAAALVDAGRAAWATQQAEPEPADTPPAVDWTEVRGVGPQIAGALEYLGLTSKADLLGYLAEHGMEGLTDIPAVGQKQALALVAYAEEG